MPVERFAESMTDILSSASSDSAATLITLLDADIEAEIENDTISIP